MIFRQIVHDDLGCATYLIGDKKAAARERSAGADRPPAAELAEHVDWSPAEVWGPLDR